MFENIYGLSCVENQTLAFLREQGMDITPFYRDSAIPIKDLFFSIVHNGQKRENFSSIPRTQDLMKNLNIISMKLIYQSVVSLSEDLKYLNKNQAIFIRVKPEFTKNRLHARGLRDDHFVRIKAKDNKYLIINDIPEITISLTFNELADIFVDEYFSVTILRKLSESDRKFLWETRKFKPESYVPFNVSKELGSLTREICSEEEFKNRICSMAFLFKVLRTRMLKYYGQYIQVDAIYSRLSDIEKHQMKLEYYNLKNNMPITKYLEIYEKLNEIDIVMQTFIGEQIKKEMI